MTKETKSSPQVDPITRAREHLESFERHVITSRHNHERLWQAHSLAGGADVLYYVADTAGQLDLAAKEYEAAKEVGPDHAALCVPHLENMERKYAEKLSALTKCITTGHILYKLNPNIGKVRQIEHLKKCLSRSRSAANIVAKHPTEFTPRQRIEAKCVTEFSKATLGQVTIRWGHLEAKYRARESAA
jgi:hypothetical protein